MRKVFVFILGVIIGVVISFVLAYSVNETTTMDYNMFESRGDIMPDKSYEIFQTIDDTHALARPVNLPFSDKVVLIIGDSESHFYDDLVIETTPDKSFYQVGTYRYETKAEILKTVPIVELLDNN